MIPKKIQISIADAQGNLQRLNFVVGSQVLGIKAQPNTGIEVVLSGSENVVQTSKNSSLPSDGGVKAARGVKLRRSGADLIIQDEKQNQDLLVIDDYYGLPQAVLEKLNLSITEDYYVQPQVVLENVAWREEDGQLIPMLGAHSWGVDEIAAVGATDVGSGAAAMHEGRLKYALAVLGIGLAIGSGGKSAAAPDTTKPNPPTEAVAADGTKITGTAEPGSTVTITDAAGNLLGTAVAAVNGTYSVSLSPALTNGQVVTATTKDAAGNVSDLVNATAPDLTAPNIVSITSSKADGAYKQDAAIALSLTVSEDVTANSTLNVMLETGTTNEVVTLTRDTINARLFTGTYTVQAGDNSSDLSVNSVALDTRVAQDSAGNSLSTVLPTGANSLDGSKALVIDTQVNPATLSNTIVVNASSTANIAPGGATNDNTLGLSGTVESGGTVRIYNDSYYGTASNLIASSVSGESNIIVITGTTWSTGSSEAKFLPTGLNNLRVVFADDVGNTTTQSFSITIDNSPPYTNLTQETLTNNGDVFFGRASETATLYLINTTAKTSSITTVAQIEALADDMWNKVSYTYDAANPTALTTGSTTGLADRDL